MPPFPVDDEVLGALERIWAAGHSAYLVGGGVRDALLGLVTTDWDVATDALPERILELFPGSTYQNRFGTVLANGIEITTFRRDHRYADHRRPERVTYSQDVYEDLARRDLTINAIAWGRRGPEEAARLLDPADGREDLERRLVRAVGDPARRFDEDALRLLRAVRIAARLDFEIEPITRAAMAQHAGDIAWISEERVASEVRRMLEPEHPSRAFSLMHDTGILESTVPEVSALARMPWPAGGDGATLLDHALATLDAVADLPGHDEATLLAALLHDIDATAARVILERLRIPGRDIDRVSLLIERSRATYDAAWTDAEVRGLMRRTGAKPLDDLLLLRRAHAAASGDADAMVAVTQLASRVEAQRQAAAPLTLGELAIDGDDLRATLGVPESPLVGSILEQLLDDVLADPSLNTRTTLLTRAGMVLDDLVQDGDATTNAGEGPVGADPRAIR